MENTPNILCNQNPSMLKTKQAVQNTDEVASNLLKAALASLDSTQKNALGISGLAEQVKSFSGYEQYIKADNAILSDSDLSMEERLKLKWENDERQDRRTARSVETVTQLQNVNTKNN